MIVGTSNPFLMLLAAIASFFLLRMLLGKLISKTDFAKKHKDGVSAVIIVAVLIMLTSPGFVGALASAIPFLALAVAILGITAFLFFGAGVKEATIERWAKSLSKNVYTWIIVVLVLSWGASLFWGQTLLEQTSPLSGMAAADPVELVFNKAILSLSLIAGIMIAAFITITRK